MFSAYIAASRRSDRSIEARVESARRASEIHKRRTGRSLRVTEQDVVNEEMYEEEDDDLPLQYRRLTAHLQTGSTDFNQRLAAYLTNHVAMRSALNQAINDSYAQQYPNAPIFSHNSPTAMFPSPLANPTFSQPFAQPFPQGNMQASPSSPQAPHPYRQTPYPMPGSAGFRPTLHHKRSTTVASPLATPGGSHSYHNSPVEAPKDHGIRRMSMPAASATKPELQSPKPKVETLASPSAQSSPGKASVHSTGSQHRSGEQKMGPPPPHQRNDSARQHAISPLTMALPQDSQMLIGSNLSLDDPFSSMLMGGNMNASMNYFDLNAYNSDRGLYHPSLGGMNATLAPSALNVSPSEQTHDDHRVDQTTALDGDMHLNLAGLKGVDFAATQTSLVNTPAADAPWDAFINDNSWGEHNTG